MFAGHTNPHTSRSQMVTATEIREGEAPAEPSAVASSAGASPSQAMGLGSHGHSSDSAHDRPEPPGDLRHDLAQYDDTLEPSFGYRWPQPPETGPRWYLLGLDVPPDVDLDRKPHDADETTWIESPQKKFERLLYETGVPLGLIVQGTLLKPAGRLACSALRAILNYNRMDVLPGRQRLHAILAESRKYQNEVATRVSSCARCSSPRGRPS